MAQAQDAPANVVQAQDAPANVVPASELHDNASDYTATLIASYVAAPVLGAGVALTIAGWDTDHLSVLGIAAGAGSALFLPATVHWLSGERRLAARAFFGWPIATLAGGLSIGLIAIVAIAVFDPFEGSDRRGFGNGFMIAAGAAIGAGMAGVAFPIFDILDTRARRAHRRIHSPPPLTFSLAPTLHGGVLGVVRGTL